ncbi:MAG: methionine--tRNA ligase [bacterium JZ-2024 1]
MVNYKKFLLTTPLYYVNASPHLGHCYTTIAADCIARWKRMLHYDVYFVTGSDEHGQKLAEAAKNAGQSPQDFVDRMVQPFQKLWDDLQITYDYFIRTTQREHIPVVQEIFRKIRQAGDIYKGVYSGWYCVFCETFLLESDLVEGNCPSCGRPVRFIEEENYFFRLSKHRNWLIQHIREHPEFIQPESRKNEVLARLETQEIRDLCVSRKKFPWGVPLPDDEEYSIYVWFDALLGYTTASGNGWDKERFLRYWPADLQLIGKDILWFHCAIWPAMLHSAGLPLPQTIFAHGFWTVGGEKMSKSKGNVLDPYDVMKEIGADGLRYFLLREIPFGLDGTISFDAMISRYNSDLANDLGNLFHRSLPLFERYFQGKVPRPGPLLAPEHHYAQLKETVRISLEENLAELKFKEALETIWKLVDFGNKYIDSEKPWELARTNPERLNTVCYFLWDDLRVLCIFLKPFIPASVEKLQKFIGGSTDMFTWESVEIFPSSERVHVGSGSPVFPRKGEKEHVKEISAPQSEKKTEISIEEFQKLDLRIGEILEATRVPGAEKLLALRVDIGGEVRTLVAGIAPAYSPQDLVGKKIVVVANLKPITIRGILSQGMLLAAGEKEVLGLLIVDKDVPPGTRVR